MHQPLGWCMAFSGYLEKPSALIRKRHWLLCNPPVPCILRENHDMKILYILLLITGPAYGQSFVPASRDSLHLQLLLPKRGLRPNLSFPPSYPGAFSFEIFSGIPGDGWARKDIDSVRSQRPDNMPCLIPNLTPVEHMPIRKPSNTGPVDPMPNAISPS